MRKLVIAAFVVAAVPALAGPMHVNAVKEVKTMNMAPQRAAETRVDRAAPTDTREVSKATRRETPRPPHKAHAWVD